MRWFQGGIAQAVATSKAQNAIFVVFVQGQDDSSQKILTVINNEDVSSKLEGQNFVAVCLQDGTETLNQFSQIYRSPAVPSLYFIGRNGVPIEIVTEVSDSSSLLEKISSIENTHFGKGKEVGTPSISKSSNESALPNTSTSNNLPSSTSSQVKLENESIPDAAVDAEPSLDNRVERAKELLQEKRLQKQQEEEEEAREKEMKRRKEGKNLQELRRWQQEEEVKQLQEERRRERRMEQEARQRVLEQIAQDRANRSAKNTVSSPAPPQTQTTSAPLVSNSNEARIQFRLPDGSQHTNRFTANTTLSEVRQYLISNVTLPFQEFSLATVFPRHEFTSRDNASTLQDLKLVPSAVLLVLAAGGHAVVNQGGQGILGFFQLVMSTLTYPIERLFTFVRSLIFGNGGNDRAGNAPPSNAPSQSQSQQTSSEKRSHRKSGGSGGTYRRAGNSNVHRLHQNHSSSDDDNNTWNGNSTQQM